MMIMIVKRPPTSKGPFSKGPLLTTRRGKEPLMMRKQGRLMMKRKRNLNAKLISPNVFINKF